MSAGKKAVKDGANFKAQVETTLRVNGFRCVPAKEFVTRLTRGESEVYAVNYEVGKNIYGKPWRANFVYRGKNGTRLIHARWQQASGSVDEKFPFFAQNAELLGLNSIFVLGGVGFKPEARTWLENQKGGRIIHVFAEEEFQEWANNGNL